jgi:hypothetical protein
MSPIDPSQEEIAFFGLQASPRVEHAIFHLPYSPRFSGECHGSARFAVEPGKIAVAVESSSADVRLRTQLAVW